MGKHRFSVRLLGSALLLATAVSAVAVPHGIAQAAAPAASSHALVKVLQTRQFGKILVTSKGYALYYFTPEKNGKIACTGSCAKVWPPLLVANGVTAPKTLSGVMGKFGVAMRPDGAHQLTFNGKPLYTFVQDKKPGQVLCDGVGGWYAVRVNGH